ncbi:MAG: aminodeoxychorismate lyase [Betaproteobacteria bacterium RBG_16_56_24]|nr:MAG: aminodeoxychorismate lyase [Betaproteobacteria bacterium RBG_16_56_24]
MLVNGKQGNLISIRDRGLLYGDGVFRTLRASGGHALHWPLHYQKLRHDCIALGIACPDSALLSAELNSLLELHPDGVVKLIVTRGEGSRGYAPHTRTEATVIWDVSPLPGYPADWATHGIKVCLCRLRLGQQPRLAGIKHLNRLENVLAAAEWNDTEVAEGLLMDAANNIIEGTRSNLFMLSQGKLITPDLSRCGVAGVQRDRVMAWAAQHNMALQVRDVSLDEVLHADELFVVNSIIGLWPIRELKQRRWTDFPVAKQIRNDLNGEDA